MRDRQYAHSNLYQAIHRLQRILKTFEEGMKYLPLHQVQSSASRINRIAQLLEVLWDRLKENRQQ